MPPLTSDAQMRIQRVHDKLVPRNMRELIDQWVGHWQKAWRMVASDAALQVNAEALVDRPSLEELRNYLLEEASLQELLVVHCALSHLWELSQNDGFNVPTDAAKMLRFAFARYFESQPVEPC